MRNPKSNLLEDVQKCMTDPIYDICKNFSLQKSREGYEKRVKQWESGNYKQNPAVKKEEVSFEFANLDDLSLKSIEAQNTFINLKREDFNKWVDWYIYGQNVVVEWYRLKTFDEWLHDWLKDALFMACQTPEDGARKIIERELWNWMYSNGAVHLFIEWIITEDVLKRLGQYEKYQEIKWRDIEEDIEQAKKALKDMEENNVTVLKLKI